MKQIQLKRYRLLQILVILLISTDIYALTPKPRPPVLIDIQSVPVSVNSIQVQFDVIVTSSVAMPTATIKVALPASIEFLEGNTQWFGDLSANQAQRITFTATVASKLMEAIVVSVAIGSGATTKTVAVAGYTHEFAVTSISVPSGEIAKASARKINANTVTKQSEGRQILEYSLD